MIDIHTHLWDWRDTPGFIADYMNSRGYFGERDGASFFTLPALLEALDEAGVEKAVLLPLRSESYGWRVSNQYVLDTVQQAPDRLIGFAGVAPLADNAVDELRLAVEDLGLRGLKLHPPMQMFDPGDVRLFRSMPSCRHTTCRCSSTRDRGRPIYLTAIPTLTWWMRLPSTFPI